LLVAVLFRLVGFEVRIGIDRVEQRNERLDRGLNAMA
jgi:hypothetical protein